MVELHDCANWVLFQLNVAYLFKAALIQHRMFTFQLGSEVLPPISFFTGSAKQRMAGLEKLHPGTACGVERQLRAVRLTLQSPLSALSCRSGNLYCTTAPSPKQTCLFDTSGVLQPLAATAFVLGRRWRFHRGHDRHRSRGASTSDHLCGPRKRLKGF